MIVTIEGMMTFVSVDVFNKLMNFTFQIKTLKSYMFSKESSDTLFEELNEDDKYKTFKFVNSLKLLSLIILAFSFIKMFLTFNGLGR